MRIGLLSDTHIPWEEKELPPQVLDVFKKEKVELILHGGDIYSHVVLDDLEKVAPVLAALGDDDYPGEDPRVKEVHALNIEGKIVWLVHEAPYFPVEPVWLSLWWQSRISPDHENYGKPDIIVSGHLHRTLVEQHDGLLHIIPGSPTLLEYKKGLGTVGILELDGDKTDVRIIQLE